MQRRRALSTTYSAVLRRSASTYLTTSPAPTPPKLTTEDGDGLGVDDNKLSRARQVLHHPLESMVAVVAVVHPDHHHRLPLLLLSLRRAQPWCPP